MSAYVAQTIAFAMVGVRVGAYRPIDSMGSKNSGLVNQWGIRDCIWGVRNCIWCTVRLGG